MQFDLPPLPPDFDPGASFIWFVLGLGVLEFLIFAGAIFAVALSEERESRMRERADSGKVSSGRKKLGTYRDEIWIADDFDAPLPPDVLARFLGEDPPNENEGKR